MPTDPDYDRLWDIVNRNNRNVYRGYQEARRDRSRSWRCRPRTVPFAKEFQRLLTPGAVAGSVPRYAAPTGWIITVDAEVLGQLAHLRGRLGRRARWPWPASRR